ncbi:MAG: DNA/RNA nuclease SfsA [Nitrospina sp.]|jgi:sugar fermentation stimulation protein A|nr:DNA/RNA nuclease SfsA [Nitrospina sp.]MBT5632319.1 DNA/RNA nuclease SfsA [Nitrospina sp.]
MRFGDNIVDGIFLKRPNRYLAHVEVKGEEVLAHVPDPGRLPGLMLDGRKVRLVYQPSPKRKTDYTLVLVRHGSIWVSVFPVFANALIQEALLKRTLPFLQGYSEFASEVKVRNSRFDFRLGFPVNPAYIEVKSVSLVEQGKGKFPDAPTERGVKHVKELTEFCAKGYRAAVVFVSQRSDTRSITCNDDIDPVFGEWLRKASSEGVELYGMNCKVTPTTISLNETVEVVL